MAETLPAIKLTDTNNQEKEPVRPFSPVGDVPAPSFDVTLKEARGRPQTPNAKSRPKQVERHESGSSGQRSSPGRLIRNLSNHSRRSSETPQDPVNGKQDNASAQPAGIDPLSKHILSRTNVSFNVSGGGRLSPSENVNNKRGSVDHGSAPAKLSDLERTDSMDSVNTHKDLRKGVKAVAFISKLMGNRKKDDERTAEEESVSDGTRPEGNDAEVFIQPSDSMPMSPSLTHPPPYIKMRSKYKKEREFDRVFLAQELLGGNRRSMHRENSSAGNKLRRKVSAPPADAKTIWAMKFSKTGKYLAAAGAEGIVRVWQVISTVDDRQKHEKQEITEIDDAASGTTDVFSTEHLSAPVFMRHPIREYEGHTSTVLDLSWSKNDFLLSSSMDKTVRLWHVSRSECLCTFKHTDFVPSISFHPKDDRFFLAGSLDSRIRLWSIPDKKVAYAAQVHDMITAVSFTPDGKNAVAGCLGGTCFFYETEGMKYLSQIQVKSRSGQNAKGSKITGVQASYDARGDIKLLITSNDSRLRLFNHRDKNLEIKFRGNENNYSQIRGMLSDDARYVICGSEDRKAYIWSVGPCEVEKRDKRPVEVFEPHNSITTCVCFAPAKTRVLLGESEDPVYDLCNPPPMPPLSREETFHSRGGSQSSSRAPSVVNSMPGTPSDARGDFKRPSQPASWLARSSHKNGNIIVTADFTGSIKVFRQDCAWSKRKGDDGDRASLFSRRTGRLGSHGSSMTRGSQPSLREAKMSSSVPRGSDHILHWRQGVSSTPNIGDALRRGSPKETPRSVSPSGLDLQHPTENSQGPNATWTGWATNSPTNKGSSTRSIPQPEATSVGEPTKTAEADAAPNDTSDRAPDSPKVKHADDNPLLLSGGRSYLFWDADEWKARGARQQAVKEEWEQEKNQPITEEGETPYEEGGHLAVRPQLQRGKTEVSELSDERSTASEDSFQEAREQAEHAIGSTTASTPGGTQALKCKNCGGTAFQAKKTKVGNTKLICLGCGGTIH